jgi:hypothetical protein
MPKKIKCMTFLIAIWLIQAVIEKLFNTIKQRIK